MTILTPEDAAEWARQYVDEQEAGEALSLVKDELERQDEQWGRQDHPVLAGNERAYFLRRAEIEKAVNDARKKNRTPAWAGILLEEVYEALSEVDPDAYEIELIQVAAVALQMWRSSRRQRAASVHTVDAVQAAFMAYADTVTRLAEMTGIPPTVLWAIEGEPSPAEADPTNPWAGIEAAPLVDRKETE
ncbi:hypothetical protein [Plantactinospora sp. WMMB782]|uniref:hypothetical protein n=1 Tax=Plantactinospora sp. WMMB782 TaxID=3404121 RepID=UPI003B924B32